MKILLTGGTGLIGRNFIKRTNQISDMDVVQIDRSTGFDFTDPRWFSRLPEEEVDVIVHLAQSRNYKEFPEGARDMFSVNVNATFELLEWARQHRVKRFVFTSTGNVYKPSENKLLETSPRDASSMYAATKIGAESLLSQYVSFFEVVILRLFGVYGPGQNRMLIANMIERVNNSIEITLAGGEGIYLTPIYITDCVEIINQFCFVALTDDFNIINVAGNEMISLAKIVRIIGEKLHKVPITRITSEAPKYFCGDNGKLKSYYEDFVPINEGLDQMVGVEST